MDPITLTVTQAVKVLACGEISAVDYVKQFIAQIQRLNPKGDTEGINAILLPNFKRALVKAKELDKLRRRGCTLGPLHGIPFLVKDSFDVAGLPTTAATPSLRINIPSISSEVVRLLEEAGAIVLAKANLAELSLQLTCTNASFAGTCKNPYDLEYTSGGSSGGSAAGVSTFMSPFALGEDTGGSVRCPAACCGVISFRPTTGRYSSQGIVPVGRSFDTAGPITRSVKDILLLDSVMVDYIPKKSCKCCSKCYRVGVPRRFFYEDLTPEVEIAMNAALVKLEESNIKLVYVDVDSNFESDVSDELTLLSTEFRADFQAYLDAHAADPDNPLPQLTVQEVIDQVATPEVKLFATLLYTPAPPELVAIAKANQLAQKAVFAKYFRDNRLDAIFVPASTHVALPLSVGILESFNIYVRTYIVESLTGLPTLALPVGVTDSGLPVACQIVGPNGSDRNVLQLGVKVEKIMGSIPAPVL